MKKFEGMSIAIVGGDLRQIELVNRFINLGANVACYSVPTEGMNNRAKISNDISDTLTGADALILPLTGIDQDCSLKYSKPKIIIDEEFLSHLKPRTPIFVGTVPKIIKDLCADSGYRLVDLANDDELNILNSIPTAEGAIMMAMSLTPFTIHGSNTVVLGFGRTAYTVARMLKAIGADVTIVARKSSDRARAFEMGFNSLSFKELLSHIFEFDIVFNTVPSMVLDDKHIEKMKLSSYIMPTEG